MEQDLISVIIPIFNGAAYMGNLVKALKAQVYCNTEIIIVDDGSKDDTLQLCYEMAGNDDRFHIYEKDNGGVSSARNFGLEKAHGDYIAFVDADDYIFPEYLSYLYILIRKHNADMACCGYYKMWDTEKVPAFRVGSEEIGFHGAKAMEDLLYRKHITVYPFLKLFRREAIGDIRFPVGIIYGEDAMFTFQVLKKCRHVVYGSRVLYIYYQHNNSATHKVEYSQYRPTWDMHVEKILKYAEKENKPILKSAYAKCFILAIDCCCRIWGDKGSIDLKKELLGYMRFADGIVLRDPECKRLNRILALFSCISPPMTVRMCIVYNCIKKTLRFETRRSV